MDRNQEAFIEFVRAGLWEEIKVNGEGLMVNDFSTGLFPSVDWREILRLAKEQSVIGLVAAGIDNIDVRCQKEDGRCRPSQEVKLQFIGQALRIEQKNLAINDFIAGLIEKLRKNDIYALLVKGQGIAQCYEKPLWRTPGDVDLLLSEENYRKAKDVLAPIADDVAGENEAAKHQTFVIKGFVVELHGRMPFGMSQRVDKVIEDAQRDVFYGGSVRSWMNGKTSVFLPSPNNDIIFVFTHLLHHFFIEGVGLRQICDWCRLLWRYRSELDIRLLESRIKQMGLMSEWKVFGAMAVEHLGMNADAMPFYDSRFKIKGEKVLKRILKCGNFGDNNDLSYRTKYTGMVYKIVAAWRRFVEFASLVPVFPVDAPRFFVRYIFGKSVVQG